MVKLVTVRNVQCIYSVGPPECRSNLFEPWKRHKYIKWTIECFKSNFRILISWAFFCFAKFCVLTIFLMARSWHTFFNGPPECRSGFFGIYLQTKQGWKVIFWLQHLLSRGNRQKKYESQKITFWPLKFDFFDFGPPECRLGSGAPVTQIWPKFDISSKMDDLLW